MNRAMNQAWLTVVGIGEDGLAGLTPAARALVESAEILVGGQRHLALVPGGTAERIPWGKDFAADAAGLVRFRGRRVVVLASGDPLDFGAGAVLARRFTPAEMTIVPAPGSIALACARLGWGRADVDVVSVHGRSLDSLSVHLTPGVRLLALSRDGNSPAEIATLLTERGFGPSPMTVFERLGGPAERRLDGVASSWPGGPAADLNIVAIECRAGPDARAWSRLAGLPDGAYRHDGQITKREVRAATLAALAPTPGESLWDLGAGSGSVAIEWLRADWRMRAVAVERDAGRVHAIAANAHALGVPHLKIVAGEAPEVFPTLGGPPDAIFAGGGLASDGFLEACWQALRPGGRLVANGVTLEAEEKLLDGRKRHGGTLTRLTVEREAFIGPRLALKPLMAVLQWAAVKP